MRVPRAALVAQGAAVLVSLVALAVALVAYTHRHGHRPRPQLIVCSEGPVPAPPHLGTAITCEARPR